MSKVPGTRTESAVGDARYDVTFTGHVQGVGFRWTTCRVAKRYDVNGWVRNESDGTVRCVAEGDRHQRDPISLRLRAGRRHRRPPAPRFRRGVVEPRGIEPLTS